MNTFLRVLAVTLLILCSVKAADEPWILAFGSCNKETLPQPLWKPIAAHKPDVWVWLGDIVYGDSADPEVLKQKYALQTAQPEFIEFQKAVPTQIGTWDDHDYGMNDGGKEFPIRAESQKLLLDFLREPASSPRRSQEGVYASYLYGTPGQQVKVILLDTRYFRDPRDSDGTMLGEKQWAWLQNELSDSSAQIHIIGSSIQVLPTEHRFEKWANFPKEQLRLLDLIATTKAPGVIFLSGDRHFAELSMRTDVPNGYPLVELTSSGLTHSYTGNKGEPNCFRVGPLTSLKNFGLVRVDWKAQTIRLEVFDEGNETAPSIEKEIPFAELSIKPPAQ